MSERGLPVVEIFGATIQGEGALAGYKCSFVRFGGCDYRCSWCDSMYAVDTAYKSAWTPLTPEAIVHRVALDGVTWVNLSGGNPAIHDLSRVTSLLHGRKKKVNVETQGSIPKSWLGQCDLVTLSPKPPSSGMVTHWEKLDECVSLSRRPVLKVVVDTMEDLHYAKKVLARYPQVHERYLQVCSHPEDTSEDILGRWRMLTQTILSDSDLAEVAILPQLHVLLFGHRRGV